MRFSCHRSLVSATLLFLLTATPTVVESFQSVQHPATATPHGCPSGLQAQPSVPDPQHRDSNRSGRRAFLDHAAALLTSSATAAAVVIGSTPAPLPALAVDDLAMPTPEEQKKLDDAAMAERLRRKAELQKKATTPTNFKDSLSREFDKKSEMKAKTKEERRDAMCQELGRGC